MPDRIIPLRTSERSAFKSCRQKWYWAYVDKLSQKRDRPALFFGSLVHAAFEQYYIPGIKRGPHPAKVLSDLYRAHLDSGKPHVYMKTPKEGADESERMNAEDLGVDLLEAYVQHYGSDQSFEVISPEQAFQVDVSSPRTGKYMFTYVGQIDAVIRRIKDGRLGFLEHKTGASLEPFGAPVELDEQNGAYWTFGPDYLQGKGILLRGEELDFVLYNRLRKSMGDQRPTNNEGLSLNLNGSVSKRQPQPRFKREFVYRGDAERLSVFNRTLNEFREMQMVRKGKLAVYKNPDKHCGYCEFRSMCEVHESGGEWEAIRDFEMELWDPYEIHNDELGSESD